MRDRFCAFVTGITACYKYIQRIKAQEMTEFGLKGTHVMCLFFLHSNPEGLTAGQLCKLCDEDKAAISRTLSELDARGYIRTNTEEGKKYKALLHLTAEGEAVARRMDGMIEAWVALGGAGLTEESREDFYKSLDHIAANLKNHYESNQEVL